MLGKRLKSDDSERRRGEIAALCALRYGDGRPKYPQAYIAALFGVTPSMVNHIARADGQLRKWTMAGYAKASPPYRGGYQ